MQPKQKIIKVGFDLDGVIIDKPPFMPKILIEWLYRSHKNKRLAYRFPNKPEQIIRWISHFPVFRPPLKKNLEYLIDYKKNNHNIVAISSRYSFLEKRTQNWIKANGLEKVFTKVYLNTKDEQPHLFKERILKKISLDMYIDDDKPLVNYLKGKVKGLDIRLVTKKNNLQKILK